MLQDIGRQRHVQRVAKTPQRIAYAVHRFEQLQVKYSLKNPTTGHFHVWSQDGVRMQFWAGTGRIMGEEKHRGIDALATLLTPVKTRQTGCKSGVAWRDTQTEPKEKGLGDIL